MPGGQISMWMRHGKRGDKFVNSVDSSWHDVYRCDPHVLLPRGTLRVKVDAWWLQRLNDFLCLPQNGLRQLDLSLLSQLWALNESIQEFRTMLQDQEQLPPQSPSQSNSDLNSLASDEDDETSNDERQTGKLIINGVTTSVTSIKDFDKRASKLIIEDMHQKLEKQIQRMRIAPPAPPTRKPPINVQSRMKIWWEL